MRYRHIFFFCPLAKNCWNLSPLAGVFNEGSSVLKCLTELWANKSPDDKCMSVMILWDLWYNRNEIVWNRKSKSAHQVLNLASSLLFQWQVAQVAEVANWNVSHSDGAMRWKRPNAGWLKCNVDAAVFTQSQKLGYSGVLRDEKGKFIAAIQGDLRGPMTPKVAEAMNFREVLSWVEREFGDQALCIESDSWTVIKSIRGSLDENSYFSGVIDDCKSLLKRHGASVCLFR
ncbi:hypothetical protein DH2020_049436 [Rehmannia glutinosa]|uniref:RNase H type-1 domain-containing protein n=1 Tax=Rehmannia glutinosa TaxID=99300 RepID=A0ABR0U3E2_REHGL